jgi:hypothetical protein
MSGRGRDFARQQGDDAQIEKAEIAQQLSGDQPQTEIVLAESLEEKRREPQAGDDDRGLMSVAETGAAQQPTRPRHRWSPAVVLSGSRRDPTAACSTDPTTQNIRPSCVLKTGPAMAMPMIRTCRTSVRRARCAMSDRRLPVARKAARSEAKIAPP